MRRYFWPLVVCAGFAVLVGFLAVGLRLDPREVPSPLINKPAPAFQLPRLDDPALTLSPQDLQGQVWLLNVWASWCVSCQQEHPLLVGLAQAGLVPVYGLNYKDQRSNAQAWLARHGDPYVHSLSDTEGLVGIDYGVYGAPETFVIDKAGVIRHKHIGVITPQALQREILPLVERLKHAP
jgi:cytochrome c biogenesis protein CcmG/thiol:disulfide interchange protein DsbE